MAEGMKPKIDIEKELFISERELSLYQTYNQNFRVYSRTTREFLEKELDGLSKLLLPSENVRVVMSFSKRDLTYDQHLSAADFARPVGVEAAYSGIPMSNLLLENENRAYKLSLRLWCHAPNRVNMPGRHFAQHTNKELKFDPLLWWRDCTYDAMLEQYEKLAMEYSASNPMIGSPDEFLSLVTRARLEDVSPASPTFPISTGWAIVSSSRVWLNASTRAPISMSTAKGRIRINAQKYAKNQPGDGMPVSFGVFGRL